MKRRESLQLNFQTLEFDVAMVGSMFEAGAMLIEPMRQKIQELASGVRMLKLDVPPVVGAVLLGMQVGGLEPSTGISNVLKDSLG